MVDCVIIATHCQIVQVAATRVSRWDDLKILFHEADYQQNGGFLWHEISVLMTDYVWVLIQCFLVFG